MSPPLKLNLGCGTDCHPGWVNVDRHAMAGVDVVWDLEVFPWPWPDSSVDEVMLIHVLEHMGATAAGFLAIVKELWRVCRGGAEVTIVVPHPRHDNFLADPTHVRPILDDTLRMFDQVWNLETRRQGGSNSPLGLMLGVDFHVFRIEQHLEDPWRGQLERGELTQEDIRVAVLRYNNVVKQTLVKWRAIKPAGGAA